MFDLTLHALVDSLKVQEVLLYYVLSVLESVRNSTLVQICDCQISLVKLLINTCPGPSCLNNLPAGNE